MPYAGNVYSVPPGTSATTLTPIDSSDYNAFVADIEQAQNDARPVIAGGTGVDSSIKGSSVNTASANRSLLRDQGGVNTVAGTGNAITITTALSWTAYGTSDGQIGTGTRLLFKAGAANTGATTLNVNSIGTKAIRKISGGSDVALAGGELVAGGYYDLVYSSAANSSAGGWIVVNAQAYNALLSAIAALTTAAGGFIRTTGVDTVVAQAIVGTVSQSGGTPTGAIIETGSNSNGRFTKFADGTMICTFVDDTSPNASSAAGNMFRSSAARTWTYPAAFSTTAGLVVTIGLKQAGRWGAIDTASTTSSDYMHYSPTSSSSTGQTSMLQAIGRWF